MNNPRDALIDAKLTLNIWGWCQNEYENDAGAHCSIGAIMAVPHREFRYAAEEILLDVIVESTTYRTIAGYNDAHGRTFEEIIAMFDKAIDKVSLEKANEHS